jgi:hypothetical protein
MQQFTGFTKITQLQIEHEKKNKYGGPLKESLSSCRTGV